MPHDYYEILEVQPSADAKSIKSSYRRLAKKYHPDKGQADNKRMYLINEAYSVLSDPVKRTKYDDTYRRSNSTSQPKSRATPTPSTRKKKRPSANQLKSAKLIEPLESGYYIAEFHKYPQVFADCTEAIRLDPENYRAYCYRASVRNFQHDFFGAIQDATEAIRLNPYFADAYAERCLALSNRGEVEAAKVDSYHAIALKPSLKTRFEHFQFETGTAFQLKQFKLEEAILTLSAQIIDNPQSARLYSLRADARKDRGEVEAAISDCVQAIALNPQDALAHFVLGEINFNKCDFSRGLKEIEEAILLDSKLARAYYVRGTIRDEQRRPNEAIVDLETYLRLSNDLDEREVWMIRDYIDLIKANNQIS